jgi:phosphatidylglycerol:prolipoprotein diacylglycerol transferase
MDALLYIVWDPDPELFTVFGISVRWYGLLFALGFLIGQQIMFFMYRKEGKPVQDVETLTIFMVIATIVGARLGHVFFYEPEKYLSDPIEILNIRGGGLASHGAAIGILIAIYLFVNYLIRFHKGKPEIKKRKRPGQSYLWVVDKVVIVTAFIGTLIRIGNFMNSEIIGEPSGSDYGVVYGHWLEDVADYYGKGNITAAETTKASPKGPAANYEAPVLLELEFKRGIDTAYVSNFIQNTLHQAVVNGPRTERFFDQPADEPLPYTLQQRSGVVKANVYVNGIPRHPTQLYEASSYLFIFLLLYLIWYRHKENTPEGLLFGIFMVTLWSFRFMWEFMKENQVAFEENMALNIGQWLSIPLILVGVFFIIYSLRNRPGTRQAEPAAK